MTVIDPSGTGAVSTRERVLVLCTANRCRSPLAEVFLRRELARRALPVQVVSAGFQESGMPATSPTVGVAATHDLDLGAHASRRVDKELLAGADLVLGMERLHVREAVVLEPTIWRRTFTLRELVRRAETAPREAGEPLGSWLASLTAFRDRADLLGTSNEDDVRDPTTDLSVDHHTTAEEIRDLVRRLVSVVWPA